MHLPNTARPARDELLGLEATEGGVTFTTNHWEYITPYDVVPYHYCFDEPTEREYRLLFTIADRDKDFLIPVAPDDGPIRITVKDAIHKEVKAVAYIPRVYGVHLYRLMVEYHFLRQFKQQQMLRHLRYLATLLDLFAEEVIQEKSIGQPNVSQTWRSLVLAAPIARAFHRVPNDQFITLRAVILRYSDLRNRGDTWRTVFELADVKTFYEGWDMLHPKYLNCMYYQSHMYT